MRKLFAFFYAIFFIFYCLILNCAFSVSNAIHVIVQNPLIGRASGSFTNAIFAKNYQKNIVRSKPVQIMDKKSPTQLIQRSWFKDLQSIINHNILFFNTAFQYASVKRSVPTSAIMELFKAPSTTNGTATVGDITQFNCSFPNLTADPLGTKTRTSKYVASVVVTVPTDLAGNRLSGNFYYFCIQRETDLAKVMWNAVVAINTGSATQTLNIVPPVGISDELFYFIMFYVVPAVPDYWSLYRGIIHIGKPGIKNLISSTVIGVVPHV
jgi:hypothetical protein